MTRFEKLLQIAPHIDDRTCYKVVGDVYRPNHSKISKLLDDHSYARRAAYKTKRDITGFTGRQLGLHIKNQLREDLT